MVTKYPKILEAARNLHNSHMKVMAAVARECRGRADIIELSEMLQSEGYDYTPRELTKMRNTAKYLARGTE
jgi:hypothetical protein